LHICFSGLLSHLKEEEMSNRHASSVIGAAVLSCAALALAQASDQRTYEQQTQEPTPTATIGQADADDMPITVVGCIQRESDYRRQQDAGRGGFLSTGLGLGNEYVLINASRAGSGSPSAVDCTTPGPGEAYELSGKAEPDLEPFVGRMVEISGTLKHADIADDQPVGTTGSAAARPSGGFDPLGQDLRLREIDVMSFREVTPQAQAAAPSRAEPAEQEDPQPVEEEEPQAAGTTGAAEQAELPSTASPLPLAGLLGLLSLAGAVGLRRLRR
jgi:hypothetical protein